MAIHQQKGHIISYDIADPRRLGRIHRYLKQCAMPIQYSVFLIRANAVELRGIVDDLEEMIDQVEDDIRVYTLPENSEIITLGQQSMAEGIYLVNVDGENDFFKL